MKMLLTQALKENSLSLSGAVQQKLLRYLALLQTWNRVFNLTTITDPREMIYLHLIDSLVMSPYLQGIRLLDVGSGAGLPGIPLAIAHPDQQWTLLDKSSKKTRFLTQAAAELELAKVSVIHHRCEDFQPPAGFDSILSRAFGTIRMFAETTVHLLAPDGILIAMKGKYPQEELADVPAAFTVEDVIRLDIKGINVERHIVRLRMKK